MFCVILNILSLGKCLGKVARKRPPGKTVSILLFDITTHIENLSEIHFLFSLSINKNEAMLCLNDSFAI
jgi:hypothetical protein